MKCCSKKKNYVKNKNKERNKSFTNQGQNPTRRNKQQFRYIGGRKIEKAKCKVN